MKENELLYGIISALVSDFLYYDRKEDEDLPPGVIEAMVATGACSQGEIVSAFSVCLGKRLNTFSHIKEIDND